MQESVSVNTVAYKKADMEALEGMRPAWWKGNDGGVPFVPNIMPKKDSPGRHSFGGMEMVELIWNRCLTQIGMARKRICLSEVVMQRLRKGFKFGIIIRHFGKVPSETK